MVARVFDWNCSINVEELRVMVPVEQMGADCIQELIIW